MCFHFSTALWTFTSRVPFLLWQCLATSHTVVDQVGQWLVTKSLRWFSSLSDQTQCVYKILPCEIMSSLAPDFSFPWHYGQVHHKWQNLVPKLSYGERWLQVLHVGSSLKGSHDEDGLDEVFSPQFCRSALGWLLIQTVQQFIHTFHLGVVL